MAFEMNDNKLVESEKQSLLGLKPNELREIAVGCGLPAFVGKQLSDWLYSKKVKSLELMTNLSKAARQDLSAKFVIGCSEPVHRMSSVDGTVKYLCLMESILNVWLWFINTVTLYAFLLRWVAKWDASFV